MPMFDVSISTSVTVIAKSKREALKFVRQSIEAGAITMDDMDARVTNQTVEEAADGE